MTPTFIFVTISAIFARGVSAFSIHPSHSNGSASRITSQDIPPAAPSVASKFFQLEERENSETCISEIFLSSDGIVTLSDSDGPPAIRSMGTWKQNNDTFEMKIMRIFRAGTNGSDIGEFEFGVERRFCGILSSIGSTIILEGSIHADDNNGADYEVGYFSVIDTTNARLGGNDDNVLKPRQGQVRSL